MMHFSGYASFVPPSGFPPPNITMAVALKSEPTRFILFSLILYLVSISVGHHRPALNNLKSKVKIR
jgi:hypothetical protein